MEKGPRLGPPRDIIVLGIERAPSHNNQVMDNYQVHVLSFPRRRPISNLLHKLSLSLPFLNNNNNTQQLVSSTSTSTLLAVRPHPSRLLRSAGRRKSSHVAQPDKMAILIRSDIKLTTGRVVHFSSSIAVRLFQRVCSPNMRQCSIWNATGQRKTVHALANDSKMNQIIQIAKQNNVAVAGVRAKTSTNSAPPAGSRGRNRSSNGGSTKKRGIVTVSDNGGKRVVESAQGEGGDDGHVWIAVGLFGPNHLIRTLTKDLPEL